MDEVASMVFSVSSRGVMPFWLLMLVAPRWRWTNRIVGSPGIVVGAIAMYAALVVPQLAHLLPVVARPRLPAIAALLGTSRGAAIAWTHFLALDLFAGRWILLDATPRGWSGWWLRPILLATLLFAPLGLGLYLLGRAGERAGVDAALRRLWQRGVRAHRPLALLTVGSAALLLGCLGWSLVDQRLVAGVPVWVKPAKFALSVGMMAPAIAWIIAQLPAERWRRRVYAAGTVIAGVAALELMIITVQAARGVASHFNQTTRLDGTLFSIMGASISLLWLAELYLAVRAFRTSFASPARSWAIRLGLAGALFGGSFGFLMAAPTPGQRAALQAHQPTPALGAHAVGVPDGGPGLPVTRWSTTGGDLRVPHFLGLHALQGLPVIAWLLSRRRRGRGQPASARPVIAAGAAWLGLTAVALVQALRGQPVSAPDALTVGLVAMVAMATLVLAGRGGRALFTFRRVAAPEGAASAVP